MRHCARWNENELGDKNGCKKVEELSVHLPGIGGAVETLVNANQTIIFEYQTNNKNSMPI